MKTKKTTLILILLMAGLFLTNHEIFPQQTASQLYEKALYLEEAKGELQEAIDIYSQLVENQDAAQSLKAKALLHMGMCYEKLGMQEAVKTYQRLVNNYPTQKDEVAIARERLNRLVQLMAVDQEIPAMPRFTRIKIPSELSWNAASSSDGQRLLLVYDEKLWTMPLSGNLGSDIPGKPIHIGTDDVKVLWAGLSWSADGKTIAFNEDNPQYLQDIPENEKKNQNIYIIPARGGNPEKIVENYCGPRAVSYRISLSPDGRTLAYSSVDEEDESHIYSISVDGSARRKLVDSQAREPVFSPDGKTIAYVEDKERGIRGGNLWTVPASGGNPILVAEAGNAGSPVWSTDASKIAFLDYLNNNKINIIPVDKDGKPTGEKVAIAAPEGTNGVTLLTGWSDNNKIGMIIGRVQCGIYTIPAEGGQAVMVFNGDATQPRWSPDGKLIFFRKEADQNADGWKDHKLAFIPADGGEITNILTIHNDKMGFLPYGMGNRVSPNGQKIVFSGKKTDDDTVYINRYPTTQIWTVSKNGETLSKITDPPIPYSDDSPCWSPDGKSVAFVRTEFKESRMNRYGEMGIYVVNASGGIPKLLISEPEEFIYSINWSPDGKWIAYLRGNKHSNDPGNSTLNIVNVDNGTSRAVGEVSNFIVHTELAWSPDSRRIAFNDMEGEVIKVMSVNDGSVKDIETSLVDARIFHLDWSPDGKRFVFVGYQGGDPEFWFLENFLPPLTSKK
jgi:Tol biopolymer transport system component